MSSEAYLKFRAFCMENKPLAVIVTGNPKYINNPDLKPLADRFYGEVKQILEDRGFRVEFDAGAEFTSPSEKAKVWVGHSRGIDRLQYAPPGVKTIALETLDTDRGSVDERGTSPRHYQLSPADKQHFNTLTP